MNQQNQLMQYIKEKKGALFAVKTKCGYAILQACSNEYHSGTIYRILSTNDPVIPKHLSKFIKKKEQYICRMDTLQESKLVLYLGTYAIPKSFFIPRYTRWCSSLRGIDAPAAYWYVYENYGLEPIPVQKYMESHYHSDLDEKTWRKLFLDLNPTGQLSLEELLMMLDNLENWTQINF